MGKPKVAELEKSDRLAEQAMVRRGREAEKGRGRILSYSPGAGTHPSEVGTG